MVNLLTMTRSLVVATVITLALIDAAFTQEVNEQQIALPEGWKGLELSDLEGTYYYDLRATKETGYLYVNGDFDGNGLEDIARILSNHDDSEYSIVISLQNENSRVRHYHLRIGNREILGLGIVKVEPGTYKTACGKGYGRCPETAATEIEIQYDALDVFMFESAAAYYYWNGTEFSREFISD